MGEKMNFASTYELMDCIYCGFMFAVPEEFNERRRQDHKGFHCPACNGSMVFRGKSREDVLKEKLAVEKLCCIRQRNRADHLSEDLDHMRHRANGYKGLAARRQRALAGYTPEKTDQTPEPPQGGTGVTRPTTEGATQ